MKILSRKGKPNKVVADYTLNDVYEDYKKLFDFPKTTGRYIGNSEVKPVSLAVFRAVNMRLYELLFMHILYKSITIILPFKLGELRIQKKEMPISLLKTKGKLKIDYKHWRQTGKIRYHLNEHRNYFRYRIYWAFANIVNVRSYKFEPTRKWHRKLSDILQKNHSIDYFE